jgi:hypothetical protein
VGDWYLNESNGDVHEKTGSSTWTLRDNLTGPQGATGSQGAQGAQGPQGDTGATGSAGAAGSKWLSGSGAPAGGTGVVGDWYLNDANGDIYEKTGASAWTLRDNLTGPQGATGSTGSQGPQGIQGPSGNDQWTYVRLSSDFVTGSATAVNVTGLSFAPAANKFYEIKGSFLLRTATATVGPRPGCSWPTGLTDGVVTFRTPSSATADLIAHGNINAAVLTAIGGLPNTTQSYQGHMTGTIRSGGSPSGNFQVQLASETAATNVTMMAGSWIAYREIP